MELSKDLRVARIRDAKEPTRTKMSAGTDFYVPKFNKSFIAELFIKNRRSLDENLIYLDVAQETIIMAPSSQLHIPSGYKVNIENFNGGKVQFKQTNRSSIAKDKQLVAGAATVDVDYQGEFCFHLINTSNRLVFIKPDDKIAQFEIIPVELPEKVVIVPEDKLYTCVSERGEGSFGSTDAATSQNHK